MVSGKIGKWALLLVVALTTGFVMSWLLGLMGVQEGLLFSVIRGAFVGVAVVLAGQRLGLLRRHDA